MVFALFFLGFKFITGNIIEVQLYARSGGDLMRMHPVVMLALMMLFDALMGMTGMFMAVPTIAAAKYYMLSMNLPQEVLDPMLVCIEGTEHGPHMNFVEQQRAAEAEGGEGAASDVPRGRSDDDLDDDEGGADEDACALNPVFV